MDKHIGSRLRLRRLRLALSQTELAAQLNVSYQQLQRYENGNNRISASRLFQTAQVLGVPVEFFFEGAETKNFKSASQDGPVNQDAYAVRAMKAFSQIPSPNVRKILVQLARAIGESARADNEGA